MLALIPAELWQYGIIDLARGLASSLTTREPDARLLIPGLGDCIPTRSARSALVAAIKALELPAGARIGVPLYCCAVVFKAIIAAGCRPRFIDVERSTFCMSPGDLAAKASEIDAVIAVHMFGNVCDTPALRDAAPGKPIIEDCALSLGSKLNGKMTGALTDIAVLSFRSGKYLSVGEGGAIFTKNDTLRARASRIIRTLPSPTRAAELVHLAKTFLRSSLRSEPLYGLLGYRLWKAYNNKVEFSDKSRVVEGQIFRTDLSLVKRRLSSLETRIERQRANAAYLDRTLRLPATMVCDEPPGVFYNRYQYPLTFVGHEQRDFMADYLHRNGIDTSKPVHDIGKLAASYYDYRGDCPTSEHLSRSALVFPTYYTLTERQLTRIGQCLNEGWAELSRATCRNTSPLPDPNAIAEAALSAQVQSKI